MLVVTSTFPQRIFGGREGREHQHGLVSIQQRFQRTKANHSIDGGVVVEVLSVWEHPEALPLQFEGSVRVPESDEN